LKSNILRKEGSVGELVAVEFCFHYIDIGNVSMEKLKEKLAEKNIAVPITIDLLDLCFLSSCAKS
jgi:hypothetical protein